jgi:hypothetical protein
MRYIIFSAVLIFSLLCLSPLYAQDYNSEEAQKAWQEAMTPGEMHALLAKAAGKWKAKITMWNDPASEPLISEGTVESEMILGGRYLQSKHTGTFMDMPMHGLAIEGYDNVKKKFINTWVDNFGTGIMISEGEYDAEKNEMVYHGNMTSPMGGEIKTRQVMKMIDDDNSVFEMYMMMNGQEFKSMRVEYTRM